MSVPRSAQSVGRNLACVGHELGRGGRVEIEHLRADEPAVADAIEAKHRTFEAISGLVHAALLPEYDHLIPVRGDDAWIHAPFGVRRLERIPDLLVGPAEGQRGRPVELDVRVEEL